MPALLDWHLLADPRVAVREAVRALRAGRVVAFPTETSPVLAASGLVPEAVQRLPDPSRLAVRGLGEARDWVPALGPLAQRLARRFWPGPLVLACRDGLELGLLDRLPPPVRRRVCPEGALHLRSPAHPAILEVLGLLGGPLVVADIPADAVPAEADADLVVQDASDYSTGAATVVETADHSFRILQAGALSEDTLRQQSTCLVVFVCTGNTCRSPLAAALCRKRLAERLGCAEEDLPRHGFTVLSAGLAALPGAPAAAEACEVATEYGADLAAHRGQPLTVELVAQADYLIAMTRGHVQALNNHYLRLGSRPRLLSPHGDDLSDPIGGDQQVYQACARQIWAYLDRLTAELVPDAPPPPAGSLSEQV
jgi:protein-tyrosine phosphatase